MTEIRLKRLTLFILETLLLQNSTRITKTFVYLFNNFIYQIFKEDKELISILYDTNILEEVIKNNYEILSYSQMNQLINRYHGFDGYLNLLETVGPKIDEKINILALKFIEFQEEYINFYQTLSNNNLKSNYQKGYTRILQ